MTKIFDGDTAFFKLLYEDEVYRVKGNKHATDATGGPALKFDGITSHTLLLFNEKSGEGIAASDKAFLDQVLKAAGLQFENLSRLNTANLPDTVGWDNISAQSASDFVIAFGVDKKHLPEGIAEGEIYNINGKRLLCAAGLPEVSTDGAKKKTLWQGLKEIYGL